MKRTIYSHLLPALALSCFVLLLTISPKAYSQQVLHSHVRPVVASGRAVPVGRLPLDTRLRLTIVLPLRNESELDDLLAKTYDPSSPYYRKFLTVSEFTDRFGPSLDDFNAVTSFFAAHGFTVGDAPTNRMIVSVHGTVEQIESTLNVSMKLYQHPTENRQFFSPDREPSLALSVPVAHIVGLNNYSIPRPAIKQGSATTPLYNATGSGPSGEFIAADMRAAYYGQAALTGAGQAVGLAEFGGYDISDVTAGLYTGASSTQSGENFTVSYPTGGKTYTVPVNNVLLDGATLAPQGDDGEQALDIVQPIGMAPGLSQVRVYIAPLDFVVSGNYSYPIHSDDTLIFNTMASENICKQLSISWNWAPEDITTNDGIFKQFAMQGQNLFAASGDYGSWPNGAYYYPEEDAYVTAVGGTDLVTSGPGGVWESPETA